MSFQCYNSSGSKILIKFEDDCTWNTKTLRFWYLYLTLYLYPPPYLYHIWICMFKCVSPINLRHANAQRTCKSVHTQRYKLACAGLIFYVWEMQEKGLTLSYFSQFSLFKRLSFCMLFISQVHITCFYSVMAAVTKKHYKHSTSKTTK